MAQTTIGIIGGSGLYEMEGLEGVEEVRVETPFGETSDAFMCGRLGEATLYFLPRHGRGHRLLPTEIPYRANIWAMKKLGVERILSVSAVGSMREEIRPGDMVIPDQFIDLTKHRQSTFFGEGCVGHVGYSDPIEPHLADCLEEAARSLEMRVHRGGAYVCMEGPQFSTRAESLVYRSWRVSVIGMTNATEAKLAREAEISYATLALVTDYDCWHETEEAVTAEAVIAVLLKNVSNAKRVLQHAIPKVKSTNEVPVPKALENSILTDPKLIPKETWERLELLIGPYVDRK